MLKFSEIIFSPRKKKKKSWKENMKNPIWNILFYLWGKPHPAN
jgi:hypothetical protein